jgi:hypothetical protein
VLQYVIEHQRADRQRETTTTSDDGFSLGLAYQKPGFVTAYDVREPESTPRLRGENVASWDPPFAGEKPLPSSVLTYRVSYRSVPR